ncbi:hypothetical protein M422DRAFT_241903 [Sphaerobolus stellatus SS14]|nr:hypothetical protein M422DRAFT_241903 [Sphaerobolus stellatus SS14]
MQSIYFACLPRTPQPVPPSILFFPVVHPPDLNFTQPDVTITRVLAIGENPIRFLPNTHDYAVPLISCFSSPLSTSATVSVSEPAAGSSHPQVFGPEVGAVETTMDSIIPAVTPVISRFSYAINPVHAHMWECLSTSNVTKARSTTNLCGEKIW